MTKLATSAAVFVVGFFMFLFASASAWILYSGAVWLFNALGPWTWLIPVAVVAEVARREKRRHQR